MLKHRKRVHFLNVILSVATRLQLMWSQSWASRGQRLSFLVCNLPWPFPIIKSSDKVNGISYLKIS